MLTVFPVGVVGFPACGPSPVMLWIFSSQTDPAFTVPNTVIVLFASDDEQVKVVLHAEVPGLLPGLVLMVMFVIPRSQLSSLPTQRSRDEQEEEKEFPRHVSFFLLNFCIHKQMFNMSFNLQYGTLSRWWINVIYFLSTVAEDQIILNIASVTASSE